MQQNVGTPTSLPVPIRNHSVTPVEPTGQTQLAKLLRSRVKPLAVPKSTFVAELTLDSPPSPIAKSNPEPVPTNATPVDAEFAPIVSKLPTVVPKSIGERKPVINSKPTVAPPLIAVAEPADVQPQTATPESIAAAEPADVQQQPAVPESIATNKLAIDSLSIDDPIKLETDLEYSTAEELGMPTSSPNQAHAASDQDGFELFPFHEEQPGASTNAELSMTAVSPVANKQAIRLREAARVSLRSAQQRMRRRATHSARMYAQEALQSIVAMQDAKQGGNSHAIQLDAALNAIRESRDFSPRLGVVDDKALKRMVTVHETQTLKYRDLDDISAVEASEAYLDFALLSLIQAAGGAREASDALIILGNVERDQAALDNAHAAAVAVTLQTAAVQIAPTNMVAHRELGITLGRQGLVDEAATSLKRSIAIKPTRAGYQRLLEVSRRSGDVDTAQECVAALRSGNYESETPVRTISPQHFAATHRPNPTVNQTQTKNKSVAQAKSETANSKPVRVSFRSILPFGRK